MERNPSSSAAYVHSTENENELYFSENSTMSVEKESSVYLNSLVSNEYSIQTVSKTYLQDDNSASATRKSSDDSGCLAPVETPAGVFAAEEQRDEGKVDWTDPSLLERLSVSNIAAALKDESFDAFISLVRSSVATLRKPVVATLFKILNKISVDVSALVKCTTESMRNMRYASTFLCCELLKTRTGATNKDISMLLDNVLVRRHRDVDPSIRSLCIASLVDIFVARPELATLRYLDIFAKSIADKNETVRRKSAKALKKMLGMKTKMSLKTFYLKNLRMIREIAQFDRCESVRSECAGLLFLLYKNGFVKKDACYIVLHMADDNTFGEIFKEIRNDLHGAGRREKRGPENNILLPIDALHELLGINEKALYLLKFSQENLNEYIEDTIRDISCVQGCKNVFACRLKMLSLICLPNTPLHYFVEILGIVKESPENIGLVVECLMRTSLRAEDEKTDEIVKTLFNLNQNFQNGILDSFLRLLKQINGAIATYYIDMILSEETCVDVAKYFDVSHFKSRNVMFQCYCFLWRAISGDFGETELDGRFDEDLSGLLNFLVFFKEKMSDTGGMGDVIRAFYNKLEDYVRRYIEARSLSFEELSEVNRLAKKGILAGVGFAKKDLIKEKMLEDFFSRLCKSRKLNRDLARRVARETRGTSAFDYLRNCVGSDVEAVCEFFVASLSMNEAIYLESKSHTRKIKSVLLRKINSKRKSDFPSSPIRENEDILSL